VQASFLKYQLALAVGAFLGRCRSVGNVAFERAFNTVLPGIDIVGTEL
jgi:hypothetical protein